MTLPSSGPISLNAIAAEFGLPANSAFPSAFYGRGGAPSSGPLSFASFYGRSNFTLTVNPAGLSVNGYGKTQTATVTSSVATTFTFSGATSVITTLQVDATHATVRVTTPSAGNGSQSGTVRVMASNGNYIDIPYSADWGTA